MRNSARPLKNSAAKPQVRSQKPLSAGVRLIVAFKMLQGAFLACLGIALWRLHNRDVDARAMQWLSHWQVGVETRLVRHALSWALQKLGSTDAHRFVLLGSATLLYALVTFAEGLGLWTQQFWAEYFTVAVSASFLPLELWEIAHHPKIGTMILAFLNVLVVVYLVNRLKIKHREHVKNR